MLWISFYSLYTERFGKEENHKYKRKDKKNPNGRLLGLLRDLRVCILEVQFGLRIDWDETR